MAKLVVCNKTKQCKFKGCYHVKPHDPEDADADCREEVECTLGKVKSKCVYLEPNEWDE